MPAIGFALLLINAVGYIFNLDIKNPALVVLGIVFVVIGMNKIRKSN